MSTPNYNGRQPNNTAYIKNFVYGIPTALWKLINYMKLDGTSIPIITTSSNISNNVLIPGDLYVGGNIINTSDFYLKTNITNIDLDITNKIMNLQPKIFEFNHDLSGQKHFGLIAQDIEHIYPELVHEKPDENVNYKGLNYLELIAKIQQMQTEIDILKHKQNNI